MLPLITSFLRVYARFFTKADEDILLGGLWDQRELTEREKQLGLDLSALIRSIVPPERGEQGVRAIEKALSVLIANGCDHKLCKDWPKAVLDWLGVQRTTRDGRTFLQMQRPGMKAAVELG